MKLKLQKRLAGEIFKCSPSRVWFNPDAASDIKQAITRNDIRSLADSGLIEKQAVVGTSSLRKKKNNLQKQKGRRVNHGSRKGKRNARLSFKTEWINKIRKQRSLILELKEKKMITTEAAKELYQKAKGGYFRSKGHLKMYLNEHKMVTKK